MVRGANHPEMCDETYASCNSEFNGLLRATGACPDYRLIISDRGDDH
jgi:hypothetical protein